MIPGNLFVSPTAYSTAAPVPMFANELSLVHSQPQICSKPLAPELRLVRFIQAIILNCILAITRTIVS